jgi:pyruvate dehydrogenase E2 component (dihydrolipoamide acetyltransferase)
MTAGRQTMLSEFRLPALGADMEEGTVVQWNVAPGDTVTRGQIVAVVETDKGAIDVEIFEDGVIRDLVVEPGTKVPVGTVMARLETLGPAAAEQPPAAPAEASRPGSPAASAAPADVAQPERPAVSVAPEEAAQRDSPATSTAPGQKGDGGVEMERVSAARPRISPAARVRARELGVEVATLAGSGPGGAITLEDVQKAGPAPRAAAGPAAAVTSARAAAGERAGGMREAIAAAMSRSKREIPHYYLSLTTDVTAAVDWLAARNASVPVTERLLFAALLIKAVARACGDFSGFSGFYRDGRYQESPVVHVGVAVAIRGGGLVAPAIMDTAQKPLVALMEEFRQLVTRARAGRLRASELAAPTIVLTSLGESPVDAVFPIIQPPQVAIVGAGAVRLRPWVVEDRVVPRQLITLSLGADHRVTDGRLGARFLARIAERVAAPDGL